MFVLCIFTMIRWISSESWAHKPDTQRPWEIYMCVADFFTSQKWLIWSDIVSLMLSMTVCSLSEWARPLIWFDNSLQNTQYSNDTRKDANQSNKVKTYRKFKTIDNNKCEDYLHQVTNTRHKITLTKLRLSNQKLAIETGRYSRPFKKPEEGICPICKIEMEDEYHFLNICPAYQEKRCSFIY